MRSETRHLLESQRRVMDGIHEDDESRVLTSWNELLSTHPEKSDEITRMVGDDHMFNPPRTVSAVADDERLEQLAKDREARLRLLRLKYLTQTIGIGFDQVETFAKETQKANPHNAVEVLGEQISHEFPGLIITERDAAIIYKLTENNDLKRRMYDQGYLNGEPGFNDLAANI